MTSTPKQIVIVGGGIAGVTAASTLRDSGFDGELTIVGAEPHRAYSRPALSKAALLDLADLNSHVLPDPGHGARELLGIGAVQLDVDAREVVLTNNETLKYDGLVIANGSHARRLGARGPGSHLSDSASVHAADSAELTLRTLEDAAQLRQRIAAQPSVVVIGGGPLGMEIASGCVAAGCAVTLVTRRLPQSALLGAHLADYLTQRAAEAGVRLLRATEISLLDLGTSARVTLSNVNAGTGPGTGAGTTIDGTRHSSDSTLTLDTELVITAIGDEPSTGWLESSGLAIDPTLGLRTDRKGRIHPNIVAAGDVAAFPHADGHRRLPLWTSAIEQAKVAAQTLLLEDEAPDLELQPYFWTEQWGISIKACGELPVAGSPEVLQGDLSEHSALLRWGDAEAGTATAVSVGMRMPIPRLRAHTRAVTSPSLAAAAS